MIIASLPPFLDPSRWPEPYLAHFDAVMVSVRGLAAPPRLPTHRGPLYLRIGGPKRLSPQDAAILEVVMQSRPIAAVLSLDALPPRIRTRFPYVPRWHQLSTRPLPSRTSYQLALSAPDTHPNTVAYLLPQRYEAYLASKHLWTPVLQTSPAHTIVTISSLHPEHALLYANELRRLYSSVL